MVFSTMNWQAIEKLAGLLKLPDNLPWRAQQNGRFLPLASPLSPAPLILLPCHGLKGGKGGFGNMLRAIGAQVCVDSKSLKSLLCTD